MGESIGAPDPAKLGPDFFAFVLCQKSVSKKFCWWEIVPLKSAQSMGEGQSTWGMGEGLSPPPSLFDLGKICVVGSIWGNWVGHGGRRQE